MAKESIKARQRKREHVVSLYADRRAALKEAKDYIGLQKLPRNASPVRLKKQMPTHRSSQRVYSRLRYL